MNNLTVTYVVFYRKIPEEIKNLIISNPTLNFSKDGIREMGDRKEPRLTLTFDTDTINVKKDRALLESSLNKLKKINKIIDYKEV